MMQQATQPRTGRGWLTLPASLASLRGSGCPGHDTPAAPHLETVLQAFLSGFNTAARHASPDEASGALRSVVPAAFEGFAFEGAGFYYALQDSVRPWRASSLHRLTTAVAPEHDFIAMVGAGFAVARLPFGARWMPRFQARLDPLTAWCVADGYGFHAGFFQWRRHVAGAVAPAGFSPQHRHLFDAGVGRAFWWVYGADEAQLVRVVARQAPDRKGAMWEGLGTALAYAGGVPPSAMRRLRDAAGAYRPDLRVGVGLAAFMRRRGGNAAEWTQQACREVLGLSEEGAAALVSRVRAEVLARPEMADPSVCRATCYLTLRAHLRTELYHA